MTAFIPTPHLFPFSFCYLGVSHRPFKVEKTHLLFLLSLLLSQLVLTVGLLAVVVYLYTVVAFNFFRKFYNKSEDDDEPDMKCDDMMTVRGYLRATWSPSLAGREGAVDRVDVEQSGDENGIQMACPKGRRVLER